MPLFDSLAAALDRQARSSSGLILDGNEIGRIRNFRTRTLEIAYPNEGVSCHWEEDGSLKYENVRFDSGNRPSEEQMQIDIANAQEQAQQEVDNILRQNMKDGIFYSQNSLQVQIMLLAKAIVSGDMHIAQNLIDSYEAIIP